MRLIGRVVQLTSLLALLGYIFYPQYLTTIIFIWMTIFFSYYSDNIVYYFYLYRDLIENYQEEKFFSYTKHMAVFGIGRNIFWIVGIVYLLTIFSISYFSIIIILPIFLVMCVRPRAKEDLEERYKRDVKAAEEYRKEHEESERKRNIISKEDRKKEFNNILKLIAAGLAVFSLPDLFSIVNSSFVPDPIKYGTFLFVILLGTLLFEGAFIKYAKTKVVFIIGLLLNIAIFSALGLITGYAAKGYNISPTLDSILFGTTLIIFMLGSLFLVTYSDI